jgi:hypothetical protein
MDEELCEQYLSHIPSKIKEEDNLELNKPFTEEEILAAINQFNPNKDLGLDGFTIHLCKRCWSIIKFDFI